MSDVKAVVFDLGGVVLGSPLEGISEYEQSHGVPEGYVNVSIVSKGRHGAFQRLERGELSLDRFYAEFREELGERKNLDKYKAYLRRKGKEVPKDLPSKVDIDTVELFRKMMEKARKISHEMCHALFILRGLGYTVAALTNNWQIDGEEGDDSSSTSKLKHLFDDIVESSVVGLRKPDPRVYDLTCKRLGVTPSQVAFLDDIGLNLKAAREFGWKTVRVELGKQKEALRKLASVIGVSASVLVPELEDVWATPTKLCFNAGAEGHEIVLDSFGFATNPAVLFLHGGGQTRHSWTKTASQFAKRGYLCLCMDMKGHGESYWDRRLGLTDAERYSMESFGRDVDSIVTALKLHEHPRGFALVGASLGGLAILSSQSAKNQAAALVLVDIAPRMALAGVQRIVSWMKETSRRGFNSLEEAAEAIQQYNPQPQTRENLEGLKNNLRKRGDGTWVWHWDPDFLTNKEATQETLALREKVLLENAARTNTPCLLVRGAQTDLVSVQAAQSLVEKMPHASFVDVQQARHMVVGDQNDAFSNATLAFLEQHLPLHVPRL